MMEIRKPYDEVDVPGIDFSNSPSMTKQSFKAECDINLILKKYQKTGVLDHINKYEGQYGEVDPHDYHEAMNIVISSQEMFDDLPARAREYFKNDPAEFLAYMEDNPQPETLRELGLALGDRKDPYAPLPTPDSDQDQPNPGAGDSDGN